MLISKRALHVGESRVGLRCVLDVEGEVDVATAAVLREALADAVSGGSAEVWLDLTRTEFLDATGVHSLLGAADMMRDLGRSFAVICPPGAVHRMLELSGALQGLAVHPDRGAANRA